MAATASVLFSKVSDCWGGFFTSSDFEGFSLVLAQLFPILLMLKIESKSDYKV